MPISANNMSASPTALILIADGTEEMEFTITYDILVRAGVHTVSAFVQDFAASVLTGPDPPFATCSRGIRIGADMYFDLAQCGPDMFDVVIIPGGARGADTLAGHPSVQELVRRYVERNKLVGMICAGSLAAQTAKLEKQPLTSHPTVKGRLQDDFEYSEDSVVVSDNLITSRGPGTAFPFALTLVEMLCGSKKREEIRGPLVFPSQTPF